MSRSSLPAVLTAILATIQPAAASAQDVAVDLCPPLPQSVYVPLRAFSADARAPLALEPDVPLLLFRVIVAGRETWAMLDTGAERSTIDTGLARELGFAMCPSGSWVNTSSGQTAAVWEIRDVAVTLPGQAEADFPYVPATDLSAFSGAVGREIGYVAGRDWFQTNLILIDTRRGVVQLGGSGAYRPSQIAREIDLAGHLPPVVEVDMNGQTARLAIDTGFTEQVSLRSESWARIVPDDAPAQSGVLVDIAGNRSEGRVTVLPEATIGDLVLKDVEVREQSTDASHDGTDGLIGLGYLSRYILVLDIKAGKLWLVPRAP